jgi:hypothetical protein
MGIPELATTAREGEMRDQLGQLLSRNSIVERAPEVAGSSLVR